MRNFSLGVFLCLGICLSSISAQSISGTVLDAKTNLPIEGASVYFDNTTKGTITNFKRKFELDYHEGITTPLIISFLGYQKMVITSYEPNKSYSILLEEDINALDEVILIANDDWTRAYKLEQFRKQFLGFSKNSESCVILNEDDIKLRFNKKSKELSAHSINPIIVLNQNLDYKVYYDLHEFIIYYDIFKIRNKKTRTIKKEVKHVKSVYYSGTSLYEPINELISRKVEKRRAKAYLGSVLHFMRALSKNRLKSEGYRIFSGGLEIEPKNYITVTPMENSDLVKVKLLKPLNILYKKKLQSIIKTDVPEFIIDVFGNHSPPNGVIFGGHIGYQRIGDALPLDFQLHVD